jgi:hypothetical protein
MVTLSRRTFEDFVGNVADDAKQAFDEILERDSGKGGGNGGGNGGESGPANLVDDVDAVKSLAELPGQLAELSRLISTLLTALEGSSAVVGAAGKVTGAAKKGR